MEKAIKDRSEAAGLDKSKCVRELIAQGFTASDCLELCNDMMDLIRRMREEMLPKEIGR